MRRIALVIAGALLGAAVWQVGFAAEPVDTLAVCTRPGTDVRSPASNGTCPSGYTKVEISETAPSVAHHAGPTTNAAFPVDVGCCPQQPVVSLELPAGRYVLTATGWHQRTGDKADHSWTLECHLRVLTGPHPSPPTVLDKTRLSKVSGFEDEGASGALTGVVHLTVARTVQVSCEVLAHGGVQQGDVLIPDAETTWDITAQPVAQSGTAIPV